MEGSCKGILAVLVILAGLAASASSNQIIEGPKNATVLVGLEARFNCTISQGWKLIMWALNGTVVLSITPKEPIITNDRFTSASYEEDGNFVSEMIIHDVQFSDAGHIKCSLQSSDHDGSAFLSVQVVGKLFIPSSGLEVTEDKPCNVTCQAAGWTPPPDLSWKIGAPVSHSSYFSIPEPGDPQSAVSVLSLTPQGNGTLTCVASMKGLLVQKSLTVNLTVVPLPSESSYHNEVRKSANARTNKEAFETKLKNGFKNYGYISDESRTAETGSPPPRSYEARVPQQRGISQPRQGPRDSQPGPASQPQVHFHTVSPRKVKNETLV
ncbi:immunoglobulin superfamily member 5 isoform X2 [Pteropus vampyrus]|uniref:immunoglobulin superfamily member 5 isoform X2 n=1 Tax=Pteropus vampyrus TaxID=132908 RepID=UPI0005BB0585|nr:immunoglobulin superfamily member 5 isoform X2 [Pteropus vampyrus]